MVKNHHILLAVSLVFFLIASACNDTKAWSGTYHLGQEWAKIWINQDGTIDLFYNISITLDSGDDINYVLVGQPKPDFTRGPAADQDGHTLTTSDVISGSDYKVRVNLYRPLKPGQTIWFTLTTNVAHMIYNDTQNLGNVGMQFIPVWWPEAEVLDLRVMIVLPENVTVQNVKTPVNWDNTSNEEGRLSIYWERQYLSPNQKYTFGVSIPKEYLPNYNPQPSDQPPYQPPIQPPSAIPAIQRYGPIFLVFAVLIVLGVVISAVSKRSYLLPTISMETLGIRRGLTAVEASCLLDLKPTMLVTEILYSLLHKRAVWVESATPSLKLKILQPFQNKAGTRETPLRYYEIDFLNSIEKDGILDEERLARTVMYLRVTVEEKMHGYCRRDTIAYYKSIVGKAWEQVEQAGAPALASNAYDEQLLWLLLDPNCKSRTETAFHDKVFEPSPFWLWYWYGYQHYHPNPTYKPNLEAPIQAGKPPAIPGADFANNIAASLEKTSNNIVANVEKFANSIVAAPRPAGDSHEPAHHAASCVCACATCACACACVSCACACAGGGVG